MTDNNTQAQNTPSSVPAIPANLLRTDVKSSPGPLPSSTDPGAPKPRKMPTQTAAGGGSRQRSTTNDKPPKNKGKPSKKTAARGSKQPPKKHAHPAGVKVPAAIAKKFKPTKGERSGAFIQRVLLAGNFPATDTVLAEICRRAYKDQSTTSKDIAWNRWKLRQDGQLPPAAKK